MTKMILFFLLMLIPGYFLTQLVFEDVSLSPKRILYTVVCAGITTGLITLLIFTF